MADFTTRLPRDCYRATQVGQLDHIAITHFNTPGFELMRRAGAVALDALRDYWPQAAEVLVFAGGGNNGGDGYVIAALAREQGLQARIIALSDPDNLQGDAASARDMARSSSVEITEIAAAESVLEAAGPHCVLVDALLGTGLDRAPAGDYRQAIALMNKARQPVLAVDIPSGLSADTGNPLEIAVQADVTVTFIGLKQGLLTGLARDYVGDVLFTDLDIDKRVYRHAEAPPAPVRRIDIHDSASYLGTRLPSSHKGSNGHVLIIGGDAGFGGAVLMAAEAALRAGAGLVSVLSRSVHRSAVLARCPEVMFHGTEDSQTDCENLLQRASVLVLGPGLGRSEWARALFQAALAAHRSGDKPLVLDADALALLAERRESSTNTRSDNWLLTPHPGEAATLLGKSVAEVQQDRFQALEDIVTRYGGTCLLKGSGSLIQTNMEGQPVYLCSEGNPGMGSGGMGDVLSGLLSGLLAQGLPDCEALCCAAVVHGEAADLVAADAGERGMRATDLMPYIQRLVNPR